MWRRCADGLNFNQQNAYYVSPLVIIDNGNLEEVPLSDTRARGYRTTIETDAAIRWIKSRPAGEPVDGHSQLLGRAHAVAAGSQGPGAAEQRPARQVTRSTR